MKPPSPPYNFDVQLAQGESGEARLDRFFSTWFQIQPATPEEQRQGIDRWFSDRRRPRTLAVEYKTDHTAARTGNAFIETISVDSEQKAGWAFTSQADLLLYYVPGRDQVYVLRTTRCAAGCRSGCGRARSGRFRTTGITRTACWSRWTSWRAVRTGCCTVRADGALLPDNRYSEHHRFHVRWYTIEVRSSATPERAVDPHLPFPQEPP